MNTSHLKTYIPSAAELAEITQLAAERSYDFDIVAEHKRNDDVYK